MSESFPARGTSAWRWGKCVAVEARLLGLPEEIPWPGELLDPAEGEALQTDELLRVIPRAHADPTASIAPLRSRLERFLEASGRCCEELAAGKLKEAGRLLDRMDELHPCPAGWLMRARWLSLRGNPKGAARLLEQCVAAVPDFAPPWVALGAAYESSGGKDEAIDAYLRGRRSCSGNVELAEALVRHGKLFRFGNRTEGDATGQYVDVTGYKERVAWQMERFGTSVEELERVSLDVARHAFDAESQEAVYRKILDLAPGHHATMVRLAGLRIRQGRLEEAESLLSRAGQGDPDLPADAALLFQLHTLAAKRGDARAAARCLDAAVAADPNHAPSLAARYADNAALPSEERESLLRQFANERNSWTAANMAAQLAFRRKDERQAVEDSGLAWKLNPGNRSVFFNYTQGLYSIGENEKLAALLQPEYRARRLDWAGKWPYAVALHNLGHRTDAVKILDEMLHDKALPKKEYPRLMEQRDAWTGYAAYPQEGWRLRHHENPDRLAEAVVVTGMNGEDTGSMIVIPAGTPSQTSNELAFDSLPPGSKEVRLDLAQEGQGAFAKKLHFGIFTVTGIEPRKLRTERLFVTFRYTRHGCMYVAARQGKRKLKMQWQEPAA